MTATDELGKHEQRVAEAQQRARAIGRDLAEHNTKIGELKQRKVVAHADQNESLATKLRKQIDEAQAKIGDLEERQQGNELASRRAAGEHQAFVAKRFRDLVDEIEPAARQATRAVDDATDTLLTTLSEWEAVKGRVAALLQLAGQATMRVPSLQWEEISHALRRRPRPTPTPLPQFAAVATIAPEHDPDPATRERARAEIKEKAKR